MFVLPLASGAQESRPAVPFVVGEELAYRAALQSITLGADTTLASENQEQEGRLRDGRD